MEVSYLHFSIFVLNYYILNRKKITVIQALYFKHSNLNMVFNKQTKFYTKDKTFELSKEFTYPSNCSKFETRKHIKILHVIKKISVFRS